LDSGRGTKFVKVNNKPLRLLRPIPTYLLVTGSILDDDIDVMALSWLTPVSKNPPKIGIVVDKSNYSHRLLTKYGWFSLAIIDVNMAELAKYVGTHSKREENKVEKLRIKIVPWDKDPRVPVLVDSLGYIVCKVEKVFDLSSSTLFISEIEDAYVKEGYFDETRGWDIEKAKILLHKAKHSFVTACDEKVVIKTPWGIAVKRPWRAKLRSLNENYGSEAEGGKEKKD